MVLLTNCYLEVAVATVWPFVVLPYKNRNVLNDTVLAALPLTQKLINLLGKLGSHAITSKIQSIAVFRSMGSQSHLRWSLAHARIGTLRNEDE